MAPDAAPSFAANSGDISILLSPETPYRPKSDRLHRSPQTRLMASVAPSSTSLYGQTFTLALTTLPSPIRQKSATTTPSARNALARTTLLRPITASLTTAPGPISTPSQRTLPSTSAPAWMTVSGPMTRSEEHTSELQSRGHLVCRLLLEKKKKDNKLVYHRKKKKKIKTNK